jgi:uncharacterized protein YceH (UPF0502 family)
MEMNIDPVGVRVLGALIEKETTTPEYYPMSLNALVNACNQKSNRDPVMQLSEEAVLHAVKELNGKHLLWNRNVAGARVMKYEHNVKAAFNFSAQELGVMCVLMLRGPQTIGEIRLRTERLCTFETMEAAEHVVRELISREDGPFVMELPRQPGRKEPRFVHLLSGKHWAEEFIKTADIPAEMGDAAPAGGTSAADRIGEIEAQVSDLQGQVLSLRQDFDALRKMLE